MKLALRQDAPTNAGIAQQFFCWVIQARLVSAYSHAGIVIDGALYHITGAKGWQIDEDGEWSPEKWDLVEFTGDKEEVKSLFAQKSQPPKNKFRALVWRILKGYDWFSLLAFTGPKVKVSWLDYCFEWCYLAITGKTPKGRITPETLLIQCQKTKKGHS